MQLLQPIGPHVVTLGVDFSDGCIPTRILYEIFRGEPSECLELMGRMSQPSHDRRPIEHWWLQCGCAQAWEEFVDDLHQTDGS